jgi:hypothetical protein
MPAGSLSEYVAGVIVQYYLSLMSADVGTKYPVMSLLHIISKEDLLNSGSNSDLKFHDILILNLFTSTAAQP